MAGKLPSGVRRRGKKFVALPYINGEHMWGGTFDEVEEAEERVREMRAENRIAPPSKETIAEASDRWLKEIEPTKKPGTMDNYRHALRKFCGEYGSKRPREITKAQARAWVLPRRTDQHGLSSFFGWLDVQDLVVQNPFSKLKLPTQRGRKDLVILTEEELGQLQSCALQAHSDNPELATVMHSLIGFMAGSGMRTSEALGLDREFVLFDDELIDVAWQVYKGKRVRPKNNETREILLTKEAAAALRALPASTQTDAYFQVGGKRLTQAKLSTAWKPIRVLFEGLFELARRAELAASRSEGQPHLVPYELRHRCATRLMEAFARRGMDGAPHVAHQLGHTDGGVLARTLYGSHHQAGFHRERIRAVLENDIEERKVA